MINSVKARTPILALILFVFSIGAFAQTTTKVVVIPLGDGPFNYAKFSGPQRDLRRTLLEDAGWRVCHSSLFTESTAIGAILANCSGAELMLACRPETGPNVFFTLAAYAPREDVTFDTGYNRTTTRTANGSEWYFNANRSWGFAPIGETVDKSSCDFDTPYGLGSKTDYRMCMHAGSGNLTHGYRCGNDGIGQEAGAGWERVILQR